MRDTLTAHERSLIEEWIARNGVTKVPMGASSDDPATELVKEMRQRSRIAAQSPFSRAKCDARGSAKRMKELYR